MRQQRIVLRNLLALGFAALLLAGSAGAAGAPGEVATAAPPAPENGDAGQDAGPGGCPGCCAGATAVDEGPRCGRAGGGGCCAMGRHAGGGTGHGRRGGGAGDGRGGGGMGHGGGPAVMQTARALVHDYRQAIERRTEEIDNGVITVTRSPSSPEAADAIRLHVREMKELLASGGRVRMWDPLFRELFDHAGQISLEIEQLDDGVRVTETSNDPAVVELIRAHARKVTEFLERGPAAVHEQTPLPAGYAAAEGARGATGATTGSDD